MPTVALRHSLKLNSIQLADHLSLAPFRSRSVPRTIGAVPRPGHCAACRIQFELGRGEKKAFEAR